ncbi:MAG: hypothetical protein JWQ45_3072, partial [Blastococcus sp.]|nr:hypothetical protein [Blastococcus sp.]
HPTARAVRPADPPTEPPPVPAPAERTAGTVLR